MVQPKYRQGKMGLVTVTTVTLSLTLMIMSIMCLELSPMRVHGASFYVNDNAQTMNGKFVKFCVRSEEHCTSAPMVQSVTGVLASDCVKTSTGGSVNLAVVCSADGLSFKVQARVYSDNACASLSLTYNTGTDTEIFGIVANIHYHAMIL
jgi:hypothetical protein